MNDFLEKKEIDIETLDKIAQMFKALGDLTRIRILCLLTKEECAVNQIANMLELSQSAVSHQLKTLRAYDCVKKRRDGQNILYKCTDQYLIDLLEGSVQYKEKQ